MTTKTELTLEQFWALPAGETAYELVDGQAIPKVSPKYFHSSLQSAFLVLIRAWCRGKGRAKPEWAITLKREGKDWVPTPDLIYISTVYRYIAAKKAVLEKWQLLCSCGTFEYPPAKPAPATLNLSGDCVRKSNAQLQELELIEAANALD